MSLREQLMIQSGTLPFDSTSPAAAAGAAAESLAARRAYQQLKMNIHQAIIDRVELDKLQRLSPEQIRRELAQLVERIVDEDKIPMNELERRRLAQDVHDEMVGLGPLEPLLNDPTISDILVNTSQHVYVERCGRLEHTDVTFYDDAHLMKIIERIVSRVGRRIDESTPMVDARLPDGSRVNAIIPPSAIDGPLVSIRRFAVNPLTVTDMVNNQSFTPAMAQLLEALIKAKLNVLISGGTGSGKTTLLNLLSGFIPEDERVVTIEDAAELQMRQQHVLRLETRPPNIEGKGEISQRSLVRNALRMRPDRIVLGEVRGAEALDMLHAMNTGHEGSMATLHVPAPVLGVFAAVAGLLPTMIVRRKRVRRILQLERQLPDAADLIARALRAGHSFPATLGMVGQELPDPLGGEFALVFDEINYGVSMNDALLNMVSRVPVEDLRYFVIAVLIQREAGGNLAEILGSISGIIRERLKLLGKVRVLSAEGRLSAWVLAVLPFAILGLLTVLNPGYISVFWKDPAGVQLAGVAITMMLFGILWMRKIVRIHI